MSALLSIGYADPAFHELGVMHNRPPMSYGDNWIDHLSWGADSAFSAARLLFCGQFLGGAMIIRSQFERWAENAAYNSGVMHRPGESAASFIGRAWAKCHEDFPFAPQEIREDSGDSLNDSWDEISEDAPEGPVVTIGNEHVVHPTRLMNSMSNFLHGRGPWIDIAHWESGQLLDGSVPHALGDCSEDLSDVLTLNLRQIRLCLATFAMEQGKVDLPSKIFSSSLERRHAGSQGPNLQSLIPLTPDAGLRPEIVIRLEEMAFAHAEVIRGRRSAGRLYQNDEFTHLHFYERRARAARWAIKAFEMEKDRTGNLNFKNLTARNFRYILAAEMAGLLSVWLKGSPAGDAAASCSSAMRSAYWLWLEDDDRSLATLRILLEQCARLRVWTEKPEKAQKLEGSPSTTPKDWINSAGWRRLSALNKALGEFSHAHANVRMQGAREILQNIHSRDAHPDDVPHIARGKTLDAITMMLLTESINSTSRVSPTIGASFKEIVEELLIDWDRLSDGKESLFDRSLAQRNAPLGDYSYTGPADALRPDRTNTADS
ncbi:hypothetical protein [Kitasatospora griseola]|uniref:hypothetical protein n=1 Tax=Kitasatospora griseola TaxID=2064 RepID=UPI003422FF26